MAGIAVSIGSLALVLVAGCGASHANESALATSTPAVSALAVPAPSTPPAPVYSAAAPTPSTSQGAPVASAAPPSTSVSPSAAVVSTPPTLLVASASFEDPAFDGGDVPKAKAAIDKLKKAVEKCVNADGGVPKEGASMKLQFLVRAPGIAEGVDVLETKGVPDKARKCVRDTFKRKRMGPPSADPVGVTLTIDFATKDPS